MNNNQCVEALQTLLAQLDKTIKTLHRKRKISGQSWGGAGAMIISNDEETLKQFQHVSAHDVVILSSPDFNELGELYALLLDHISKSASYNHITKMTIWPEITKALIEIEGTDSATLEQKVVVAINKTIELISSDI